MPTLTRSRVLLVVGLALLLAATTLATVDASSHREAPLIAQDPVADNTDTYAFVSPADPDRVVLAANYIPLQQPAGGPNFHNFGDDVLYAIHVDNDGDAVADITYEFRFTTQLTNPDTFLYTTGTIESLDDPDWNLRQTYTLSVVADGVRTVLGQGLPVPPNNIGPRSTPDYAALAEAAVVDLDGGVTAFAGQRDDPFWVDLGSIFDLGGLRPFNDLHVAPLDVADGVDAVAGKNTHALVLEVPTDLLTQGDEPVIGVWATAERRRTRTFADGSSAAPVHSGPFTQVSRLGMPLVNEVVIPLGLKDVFNTLSPSQDAAALAGVESGSSTEGAVPIVTDPELADLIPVLYPGVQPPPAPRDDIFSVFLTGVEGLNQFSDPDAVPAEMIRLNTSIPPSSSDPNDVDRLGVLGGETDGFPNGRRLGDDTVDIELQVVAGILVDPDNTPPLSDGVLGNDVPFLTSFPYLAHPHDGYSSLE